jgi:hypothetical protein
MRTRLNLEELGTIAAPSGITWGDDPLMIPIAGAELLTPVPDPGAGNWVMDFGTMVANSGDVIGNANLESAGVINLTAYATIVEIGANGMPTGEVGYLEVEFGIEAPDGQTFSPNPLAIVVPISVSLENAGFTTINQTGGVSGWNYMNVSPVWSSGGRTGLITSFTIEVTSATGIDGEQVQNGETLFPGTTFVPH